MNQQIAILGIWQSCWHFQSTELYVIQLNVPRISPFFCQQNKYTCVKSKIKELFGQKCVFVEILFFQT